MTVKEFFFVGSKLANERRGKDERPLYDLSGFVDLREAMVRLTERCRDRSSQLTLKVLTRKLERAIIGLRLADTVDVGEPMDAAA